MTAELPRRPVLHGTLVNALQGQDLTKKGVGKHLQPGVVTYDNEDGTKTTYLLELDAIARMRKTATGKPVVGKSGGFDHVKVENGKQYDGVAVDSFWDGESGWEAFHFDGMNAETAKACEKGFQVSCAYIPTETDGKPGLWHNVPYDEKILDGEYTHFAVVPNPRYEGATIELFNSKGGGFMNKVLKAVLALVPRGELREVFNSIEEDDKKKEAEEKKNAEDEKVGKRKAAQDAFDASMKNASSDEDRAKAKEAFEKANAEIDAPAPSVAVDPPSSALPAQPLGGGDVTPEPGLPGQQGGAAAKPPVAANAETPEQAQLREKKAAEAAALKNAEDAKIKDDKDKKEAEEKKNALELKNKAEAEAKRAAEQRERFNNLRKLAEERGGSIGTPFVGIVSQQEKEDLGRDRYGSRKD